MGDSSDEIIFLEEIKGIKSEKENFCAKSEAKKRRNSSINSTATLNEELEKSLDDCIREPGTFFILFEIFLNRNSDSCQLNTFFLFRVEKTQFRA
jgi:hypothetical protein